MGFNPFKAFKESIEDDLALNLLTGGAFGLTETLVEGAGQIPSDFLSSGNQKFDLLDTDKDKDKDEISKLRDEQERLRRERQPGRRQTLLSLNSSKSNNLITGL